MSVLSLMSLKCLRLNGVSDRIAYSGHSLIAGSLRYYWALIDGMVLLDVALRWLHGQLIGIGGALLIHHGSVVHSVLGARDAQSPLVEVERRSSWYCER